MRINIFFFSTFIIFSVIIVRLAFLQFVEGPELTQQETGGRTKNYPLNPIRGSILDAAGTPIAYSKPSNALYVTLLKNYNKNSPAGEKNRPEIEAFAEQMVEAFNKHGEPDAKLTVEEVIALLDLESNRQHGYEPRRIKGDLTDKEVAFFIENKQQFPGVEIVEENVRYYDTDTVAVQAVGYLKKFSGQKSLDKYAAIDKKNSDREPGLTYMESELVGVDGLELMFQDALRGKSGYMSIPINPQNMIDGVPSLMPPEKGYNVYTTIHKDIQMEAEQAIVDQLKWLRTTPFSGETHPEAQTGYAVAMEVDTGNIVAMASIPDYDPNVWKDGTQDWDHVTAHYKNGTITPYGSGRSKNGLDSVPWLGSTIKPLSVLIGLQEGLFAANDYYYDQGFAQIGKDERKVRNSLSKVLGSINGAVAIEKSSNAFMIDMVGEKLFNKYGASGIEVWDNYMKQFGLGVSTQSGLPKEFLGKIDYDNIEQAGSAMAALSFASFGQSGGYTTLQLAQYTATIANKGERIKPQMALKIENQDGQVIQTFKRQVLNTVEFEDKHWDEVIKGMNTQGLSSFEGFGYDFARKTGTSEMVIYENGEAKFTDNGVFVAFAPRDKPKLAVAVIVPEGGFGSYSAAPIARKIFDAYDEVYGLDGTPHPKVEGTEGEGEAAEELQEEGAAPAAEGNPQEVAE
ncbi:penicillin-binding protein 2 [Paenibacillus sp. F411]|uniref:peptidoglycan D,D-transpeptidase FtsI family protein n=1 Tax=Paenibacillus sp. F411 TaxID=2820239 RepID=UPI001AAF1F24|nr:penicillin-binding transpeptidase domain-containing protein [Paenibacillus sp. F411]MBO2943887.1 penicillin-binding protein 2 [Paenibacillus sp. F411]